MGPQLCVCVMQQHVFDETGNVYFVSTVVLILVALVFLDVRSMSPTTVFPEMA